MKEYIHKMQEIVDKLNEWSYAYYVLDNPVVEDSVYDVLYDELLNLEQKYNFILPDSPTRRVGDKLVDSFQKHEHLHRLYSLDKATTVEQMHAFYQRIEKVVHQPEYTVEYKYDGITICITYENGYFQRATTRGNGTVGEDVTTQVLPIKSFPLKIEYLGKLEVKGEAIMRLSALEKYNKTAEEKLKNARNAVGGAIRNLDSSVSKKRNIEIFFYDINYIENNSIHSQSESIAFLKKNGFKVFEDAIVCNSREDVLSAIERINQTRQHLDVLTDGVVIKVDNFIMREEIGYTDKFPKWAIAYKFQAEEKITTIKQVFWQVGRTGKLTPLAEVEPIELAGATVRRATLNNLADIERKKIQLGSSVYIRRSNEVIPEILMAIEGTGKGVILPPATCPYCGADIVEDGANLFCSNTECPPRVVASLVHFASNDGMHIDTLSEKTIELFYNEKLVEKFSDIYRLTEDKLIQLEGFKEKKIKNLLQAIEKSKQKKFEQFLFALGIDGIGKVAANDIAKHFQTLQNLQQATLDELLQIEQIGEKTATNIVNFFQDKKNIEELEALQNLGVTIQMPVETTGGKFAKQYVVLTGVLTQLKRREAEKLIEAEGGICQNTVTSKTNLVIAGEKAGSKLEKAQAMGIAILDEDEFLQLLKKE